MTAIRMVCALAMFIFCASAAHAGKYWNIKTLHTFCSQTNCVDGNAPLAGVVSDAYGNLYGTTEVGGAYNEGTVYELQKKDHGFSFRVIHDFCRKSNCPDGYAPAAGLIADINGNIYGVTLGGGTNIHGCGVVFELSPPKWKLKTLHSFCDGDQDGDEPSAALGYFGKSAGAFYDGVSPLYGVTYQGGAHDGGIVFSLEPKSGKWKETILHDFCGQQNCPDGENPNGELLVDASGNLFGATFLGGASVEGIGGGGTVYEITPSTEHRGAKERVLYSFCSVENCADGVQPTGALIMDAKGALLGVTEAADGESGVIFKLTPDDSGWTETVEHTFCSGRCTDGYLPSGGLYQDSEGNAYGVTEQGGTGEGGIGGGAVFLFDGKNVTPIYEFCSKANCADGRVPEGTLFRAPDGTLFGTTSQGGKTSQAGTVFALTPD